MNDYNRNKHQMKAKIVNLVNKFCKCLTQPKGKFFTEMIQGTLVSKSVLISEISRAISTEKDKIKHVEKRLLRNLKSINNQAELQDTYQRLIDKKFDNDTIFCVDNSDITKSNRQNKFEHMSIIRDGSTEEYKPGYHVTSIVALDRQNKNPISVYNKVFSLKEEEVTSLHQETVNALQQSFKHHKNKGLYVFDRGYDDIKLMKFMEENNTHFLIRIKNNRNFIYKKHIQNVEDIAKKYKGKYKLDYYDDSTAKVSYIPVQLPKNKDKNYLLIVVYPEDSLPIFLLTNLSDHDPRISLAIAKSYILRWKIEEYFRFLKQSFDLENIRLRKLKDINLMLFILQLSTYIIAEISHGISEKLKLVLIKISQPIKEQETVKFDYYRIVNGIRKLLNFGPILQSREKLKARKNRSQPSFRFNSYQINHLLEYM